MILFRDRHGNPMAPEAAGALMEDIKARAVEQTTLPNGLWVSTVHLVLDHAHGRGRPLIFETMVFDSADLMAEARDCARYSTEAEAQAGHAAMVEKWRQV